jgi:hypothetical protein
MGEGEIAQLMRLKLPEVRQLQASVIADGPIIVFAGDGTLERLPLRVALDAGVVSLHIALSSGLRMLSRLGLATWALPAP